ncbi:MAG: O-antigen ligase family protein [candidate division WS1 bacterium]|nr:O-antigen ligase family protein [candidate division WS1 bacterium]
MERPGSAPAYPWAPWLFGVWAWLPAFVIIALRQGEAFAASTAQLLTSVPLALWPIVLIVAHSGFRAGVHRLALRSGLLLSFAAPYAVLCAIGGLNGNDLLLTIGRPASELVSLLLVGGWLALLSGEASERRALTAFALIGALFCTYYMVTTPVDPVYMRLAGAANANQIGLYAMATMLSSAAGPHWLWGAGFVPALVLWFRTNSRASLLGTGAGLVTLALLRPRARVLGLVALAALATAFLFTDAPVRVVSDMMALEDPQRGIGSGLSGRTERYSSGMVRFEERPLLGHGLHPNNYHNAYIEILAQHGLVGGVLFLLLLRRALTGLWRERRAPMASALLAYAVGYLVRVMFEGALLRPSNSAGILFSTALAYGWLALGQARGVLSGTRRERSDGGTVS